MSLSFNRPILLLCTALAFCFPALAQHSAQERKEDATRHRAMATAHEAAARCLESAKPEDVCMKELQTACKSLAIGKYCGMKHGH